MPKNRIIRSIDLPPTQNVGGAVLTTIEDYAPPAIPSVPAPDAPSLTTALARSAVTPTALISATWKKPTGVEPQFYVIQWSTDSSFPDGQTSGQDAPQLSATIEGLKPATTYYVRVAAVYRAVQSPWSDATSIPTDNDTTPPDPPGVPTWTWLDTGDLIVRSTEPTNANYHWLEIKVWTDATKTTLLTTAYFVGGSYTWTLSENQRTTGSSGDAAVYIELRSQSWTGYFSSAVVPATQPSKPAPSAPTSLTTSWAGDTGTAGPDCTITCSAPSGAVRYVWTIDGLTIPSTVPRLVHSLDSNRAQHSGTPDPVLSISVVAYDALGQASPTASTTATNAAPAAPATVTMTTGGVSTIGIAIGATRPPDFASFTVRVLQNGSTLETITKSDTLFVYQATTPATYQFGVKVVDVFGQSSGETLSSAVALDFLTTAKLREDSSYTDSIATDFTTGSNKTVLKDDATGAGVSYAISASAYRWTQVEHALIERIRRISVKCGSGGASFYVAVSQDGTTWRWFAGLTSSYLLTERADEATAQSNAALTTSLTYGWCELPATIECRYIKLYHRNTGATYRLDEFYAYTLVVADMIRAGDIQTLHLGAGVVTADKISVAQLAAITADLGTITAGTITGATIQTAMSGARIVLSSDTNGGAIGYGASDTYNPSSGAGTYQILWYKVDGKLYAGAGVVVLDSNGIGITGDSFTFALSNISPPTILRTKTIQWSVGSGTAPSVAGSSSNGQLLARGQRITLAIPVSNSDSYGLDLQSSGAHRMTADTVSIDAGGSTAPTAFRVKTDITTAANCAAYSAGTLTAGSATTNDGQLNSRSSNDTKLVLTDTRSYSNGTTRIVDLHFKAANPGSDFTQNSATIRADITPATGITVPASELSFWTANNTTGAGKRVAITGAGDMLPKGTAGTQNLGDATNYWGDVSYKTITDRGCLALIDAWQLCDGSLVSAREAFKALKAHPSDKTIYGETKLDYGSVPKHSYKPAPIAEADVYEEYENGVGLVDKQGRTLRTRILKQKKGDKLGEDGVEMTALFSLMITHHRELIAENEAQEGRIAALEVENALLRESIAQILGRLNALEHQK